MVPRKGKVEDYFWFNIAGTVIQAITESQSRA